MIVAPFILLVILWVGASIFDPTTPRPWLFPTVFAVHSSLALALTVGGWSAWSPGRRVWALWRFLLIGLPPLSPVLFCHLCSDRLRVAARGRGAEDALGEDLRAAARLWFGTANAGVVLCVFWLVSAFSTLHVPLPGRPFHPWLDPLRDFRDAPATMLRMVFLVLSLWFGGLLHKTLRLLWAARSLGASAPGEEGEAP